MNSGKFYISIVLSSVIGGLMALGGYMLVNGEGSGTPKSIEEQQNIYLSHYDPQKRKVVVPNGLDFTAGATKSTPAVVHIKSYYDGYAKEYGRYSMEELLRDFFGGEAPDDYADDMERMATGSGVLITANGYIATNNHVVEGASSIEVVLNDKRSYEGEVIGTDPSTDLALIKIKDEGLPFLVYGNSDEVNVGQWVLAVGNPFDLTSTVTAGIVSAKARNINILRSKSRLSIESFIQTDAAVNPGNSGGALVNLEGELIGINTAIATNTGSYAGYSFAVPVTLVRKVMVDLQEFGEVKRALMGVSIQEIDAKMADALSLKQIKGVYISGVASEGGAAQAGLEPGDVVVSINGKPVNSVSELQELVARHRPGQSIDVNYKRGNLYMQASITLQGQQPPTDGFAQRPEEEDGAALEENIEKGIDIPELGGSFAPISEADQKAFAIDAGVKVLSISEGRLKDAGMKDGFIITKVDKQPISSPADLQAAIANVSGGLLIEGYNKEGQREFIGVGF